MNVFDWRGPEFLVFYFILVVLAMMVGALLRWMLRTPGGAAHLGATKLDPYEIAYLNGRETLATEAAVARLVKSQLLQVNTAERLLLATNNLLPVGVHPLERAVGVGEEVTDLGAADRVEMAGRREVVDEEPVALVGRHPAGAGVRLAEEALLLQHGHVVADGRGRHRDAGGLGHVTRPHRLRGVDVLLHDGTEDGGFAVIEHGKSP